MRIGAPGFVLSPIVYGVVGSLPEAVDHIDVTVPVERFLPVVLRGHTVRKSMDLADRKGNLTVLGLVFAEGTQLQFVQVGKQVRQGQRAIPFGRDIPQVRTTA